MKATKNRYGIHHAMEKMLFLMMSAIMMMTYCACSDDDDSPVVPTPVPTNNKAAMILDKAKLDMIYSLVDLEGNKGRIYEMNYTVDYKLEDALKFQISSTKSLTTFVALYLMDTIPSTRSIDINYDAGCSVFACPDKKSGDYIMGRNFDFSHLDPDTKERIMIPVIAVHTAPAGGKKSVSFVDGQFLNYASGFYNDGTSDLSMLMAVPYVLLDGINEDGFAVSVLKLDGLYAQQQDPNKKKIFTTVAMRMLLDKASTVKEAISLLEDYNIAMDKVNASYHFFMADAKGDYAIVEYTNPDTSKNPDKMEVLTGNDTLRCVTNFYVSPTMINTEHGFLQSDHGKQRYEYLREGLLDNNYALTPSSGMKLLQKVAQGPEVQLTTGFTQWSEIYNLSRKTVTMSLLRDYNKTFEFEIQ